MKIPKMGQIDPWPGRSGSSQKQQGVQSWPPDPLQALVKVPSKGHLLERAGPGATDVAVEAVQKGQGSKTGKLQMLQTVAKASTEPRMWLENHRTCLC